MTDKFQGLARGNGIVAALFDNDGGNYSILSNTTLNCYIEAQRLCKLWKKTRHQV